MFRIEFSTKPHHQFFEKKVLGNILKWYAALNDVQKCNKQVLKENSASKNSLSFLTFACVQSLNLVTFFDAESRKSWKSQWQNVRSSFLKIDWKSVRKNVVDSKKAKYRWNTYLIFNCFISFKLTAFARIAWLGCNFFKNVVMRFLHFTWKWLQQSIKGTWMFLKAFLSA